MKDTEADRKCYKKQITDLIMQDNEDLVKGGKPTTIEEAEAMAQEALDFAETIDRESHLDKAKEYLRRAEKALLAKEPRKPSKELSNWTFPKYKSGSPIVKDGAFTVSYLLGKTNKTIRSFLYGVDDEADARRVIMGMHPEARIIRVTQTRGERK